VAPGAASREQFYPSKHPTAKRLAAMSIRCRQLSRPRRLQELTELAQAAIALNHAVTTSASSRQDNPNQKSLSVDLLFRAEFFEGLRITKTS
jgi:hypothetical protein